jgi:hypothetical protein
MIVEHGGGGGDGNEGPGAGWRTSLVLEGEAKKGKLCLAATQISLGEIGSDPNLAFSLFG